MELLTEKEKAKLDHKFKIWQIILDKVLWGVVIILLGIVANTVFERYKADLTKERFFLEKKYDAILKFQTAFSILYRKFDRFTVTDNKYKLPPDYLEIYTDSLYDFYQASNETLLLLSKQFGECLTYFGNIFSGINQKDVAKCGNYRMFVNEVAYWLQGNLYRELGFDVAFEPGDYPFKGIDRQMVYELDNIGSAYFLDSEFEKWKKWRKSHKKK